MIYYNVYIAEDPMGPWVKKNSALLSNNTAGNSFTLTDLNNDHLYYIMVVGGELNEAGVFVPLCGQPIGPEAEAGTDVANPNIVAARPKAVV